MTNKPIDLIVANAMHANAADMPKVHTLMAAFQKAGIEIPDDKSYQATIARDLLCQIAHQAKLSTVFAALQAVGAPCSIDDINTGLQAVKEA